MATVDAQQAYSPAAGSYRKTVHLTKDGKSGQWRIDSLPQGVVMGQSDFQRNYTSVDKYYFASDTSAGETGQPVAVADPVFVRSKVDPTTQLVRSLLNGPTSWLGPVVRSSFPTGTALKKGVSGLTPDDQNRLRHMPDVYVRPGGVPFGTSYASTPISPADLITELPTVSLAVEPLLPSVPIGAPVRVNLILTNNGNAPVAAPPSLSLGAGYVRGRVIDASGVAKSFSPDTCQPSRSARIAPVWRPGMSHV